MGQGVRRVGRGGCWVLSNWGQTGPCSSHPAKGAQGEGGLAPCHRGAGEGGRGHLAQVAEGARRYQGAVHRLHPTRGSVHKRGLRGDTPFPSTANNSQENSKPAGKPPFMQTRREGPRHSPPERGEGRVKLWGCRGAAPSPSPPAPRTYWLSSLAACKERERGHGPPR